MLEDGALRRKQHVRLVLGGRIVARRIGFDVQGSAESMFSF